MVVELKVRDHTAAFIERLEEYASDNNVPGMHVWQGGSVPQNPTYPYVVVWPSMRFDASVRRISDDSVTQAFRFVTQYAAQSSGSVLALQEHVYQALNGYSLVVDDVECSRIHHEPGAPVARDPDQDYLYIGADSWLFVSTPQLQ